MHGLFDPGSSGAVHCPAWQTVWGALAADLPVWGMAFSHGLRWRTTPAPPSVIAAVTSPEAGCDGWAGLGAFDPGTGWTENPKTVLPPPPPVLGFLGQNSPGVVLTCSRGGGVDPRTKAFRAAPDGGPEITISTEH